MKTYSDKDLLKGIFREDSKIIQFIYKQWFPMIERMVLNLRGNTSDAQDVFQDAMIILYRKIKAGEFELCCKFSTYLYAIAEKIWVQKLKSAEMRNMSYMSSVNMVCEPEPEYQDESLIFAIVEKHIESMSRDCQKILRLHFNRATIKQINKIMGYRSTHHTMDRKYRCKQSLIKRILRDPEFRELSDSNTEVKKYIPSQNRKNA